MSGRKKYELKGRGGREAFVAEDTAGQGMVLAAWSRTPFTFDRYVKDGRWDLSALSGQGLQRGDAEAHLMSIVDDMQTPGGHFDYDVAVYTVSAPHYARALYAYPYGWPGWWGYDSWWGFGPRCSPPRSTSSRCGGSASAAGSVRRHGGRQPAELSSPTRRTSGR